MKRVITGICYVVTVLTLILLSWYVPDGYGKFGFDALFLLIAIVGTYEMLNAMNCVSQRQRAIVYICNATVIPVYAITASLYNSGTVRISYFPSVSVAIVFGVCVMALAIMTVFDYPNSDLKSTAFSIFAMAYCGLLPLIVCAVNHLPVNSHYAVIYMFAVTASTDTFALVFGLLFRKIFPQKLSPELSPKKTIIGGFGGIVGGIIGAAIGYVIYVYILGGTFIYNGPVHVIWVIFMFTVINSIVGQIGDLFESAIKRYCNVKDIGNFLPGHGGILDRFDSMLFISPFVLLTFALLSVL